jgi:hypothetical protein
VELAFELEERDDVLHAATTTHDATSAMRLEERLMENPDRAHRQGRAQKLRDQEVRSPEQERCHFAIPRAYVRADPPGMA